MSDTDAPEPPSEPPAPPVAPKASWPRKLLSVFWNADERRVRALWRIVALGLAMTGAGLAIRATGMLPERGTHAFYVVGTAVRTVVALAVVGLVGRLLDRRRLRDYGLRISGGWLVDFVFGLGLGAGLMTGIFLVQWRLGWLSVTGSWRRTAADMPFGQAILVPLVVFVCVGIVEELIARGYLLRNLAEGLAFRRLGGPRGGLIAAIVISSALFALGHLGNPNTTWVSTVNIGLAGALLALGYVLTGQLALPIGLHITWNLFQASVFGFPVSGVTRIRTTVLATVETGPDLWTGGVFGPEAGLLGVVAMLVGIGLMLAWVRWRRGEVRRVASLAAPPARRVSRAVAPTAG